MPIFDHFYSTDRPFLLLLLLWGQPSPAGRWSGEWGTSNLLDCWSRVCQSIFCNMLETVLWTDLPKSGDAVNWSQTRCSSTLQVMKKCHQELQRTPAQPTTASTSSCPSLQSVDTRNSHRRKTIASFFFRMLFLSLNQFARSTSASTSEAV